MADCPEAGITQLQDLLNASRFKDIILAGITASEKLLDEGDKALQAGQFDQAEASWEKAWANLRWILLNVIQRRLRVGKNEGAEIRVRLKRLCTRMLLFGLKKKLVAASVSGNAREEL